MPPTFIGSFIGISRRHELIIWVIISILTNFLDRAPMEIGSNLKQIWDVNLDTKLFPDGVQNNLKRLLTGVVMVRSITSQMHVVCSLVLLWPLFFEERPSLCYPWLIVSGLKNLGTSLLSFAAGLFICCSYGACRPACLIFSVEQMWNIIPSLYMWLNVNSFCQVLKKLKVVDSKLPSQIQELETLTAIRRRMVRSMATEAELRQQIENKKKTGNSALALEDIFKPEGFQSLDKGTKSLDTLLEDMANEEFLDAEDDPTSESIEDDLKPPEITMKLLGITESQIEAAKLSRSNGLAFAQTSYPKLKVHYPKCTRLSELATTDKAGPSTSKGFRSKLLFQTSLYSIPPKILRKTKSEIKQKHSPVPPQFLNEFIEKEVKNISIETLSKTETTDTEDDSDCSEPKKKFPKNNRRDKSVDKLYSIKTSPSKVDKLTQLLRTPIKNYSLLAKIKKELIEKMFLENNSELQKYQKIIETRRLVINNSRDFTVFDSKASTDLSIKSDKRIYPRYSQIGDMDSSDSSLSFQGKARLFPDDSLGKVGGNISESASDSLVPFSFSSSSSQLFDKESKNFQNEMKKSVSSLVVKSEKAKKLLVNIKDPAVRELCHKILDAIIDAENNNKQVEIPTNSEKCLLSVLKFIEDHLMAESLDIKNSTNLMIMLNTISKTGVFERPERNKGGDGSRVNSREIIVCLEKKKMFHEVKAKPSGSRTEQVVFFKKETPETEEKAVILSNEVATNLKNELHKEMTRYFESRRGLAKLNASKAPQGTSSKKVTLVPNLPRKKISANPSFSKQKFRPTANPIKPKQYSDLKSKSVALPVPKSSLAIKTDKITIIDSSPENNLKNLSSVNATLSVTNYDSRIMDFRITEKSGSKKKHVPVNTQKTKYGQFSSTTKMEPYKIVKIDSEWSRTFPTGGRNKQGYLELYTKKKKLMRRTSG